MVKTKMEFQGIFQAAFPGITTVTKVHEAFFKVVKVIDTLQKRINTIDWKVITGKMPEDVGKTAMANLGKEVENYQKDLVILGKAVSDAYDPQITYVKDATHAIDEQRAAVDELATSVTKVPDVKLIPPTGARDEGQFFVKKDVIDKTIGKQEADIITAKAGKDTIVNLAEAIKLQEIYIKNLDTVPDKQQDAIADLEKLNALEDQLIMTLDDEKTTIQDIVNLNKQNAEAIAEDVSLTLDLEQAYGEVNDRIANAATEQQKINEKIAAAATISENAAVATKKAAELKLSEADAQDIINAEIEEQVVAQEKVTQETERTLGKMVAIGRAAGRDAAGKSVYKPRQTGFTLEGAVATGQAAGLKAISKQVLVTKAIGGYVGRVVQRYREWKKKQEEITNGTEKQVRELSKVERVIKRIHKAIGGFAKRVRRVSRTIRAWGRNFLWLGRDITIFTSMAIGAAVKSTAMWAKFAEQVKITQRVLTRRWATGRGEKFGPEDVAPGADIGGVTAEAALFGDPGTIMGLVAYAANQMAISISAATMSFGHLIRAGYGTVEALNVSNQAMILNRGSMISLADATDMMITIQKNFSKQIYDAAKIADIMTVADMNAVASMSELQSGMGFVSGTAARMGMSLEQTAAAMVLLTNAGFSGSVAGRELRSVLNNLMQNAEDYGIRIKDATGEMLPFETVLQSVEDRMNYFGTELERTQFLQEVFGETNISMVQALLRNKSELQALTNEFDDSGGAAEKAADTMKQTLEYRLDQLRVGFEKVQLAIGKGFSEALVGGDDFLGQLAKTLETVLPIVAELAFSFGVGFVESLSFFVSIAQEAIGYVMDFAEALGFISDSATTATGEVDETSGRVEFLGQSFGKVAGFALVVGPAMMAIGMALEILSPIMFGLGLIATLLAGGFGALTSAAGLAAGAIGGLGTVLAVIAGVVGAPVWVVVLAIVAALVLLSGIVIAITSEWDRFAAALDGLVRPILLALEFIFIALWHVIEPVVSIIFSLVEILLKLGMIIGGLIIIIVEILDFFKIWDILGIAIATGLGLIGIALELLAVPLQFFADLLEGISNALDWVVGLILGSSPGLIPALEALFAILGAPLDLAFGFLDTALENIGIAIDSLIGAFDSLVGAAQGAFDKLAEGDLIGAGQELVGGAIGAGQALGGGALDAAVNSIGDLADGVGGLVCGFFGCSPGLIPALEASTAAMQNFNEEAEKMKSKNITVAGSLKMTNKELSAMMGTNLDSWNQQVSGKGRDVVELGAETLRALARILLQEEKDWDWSVGKQRDQERDLTTPQIVSKRIYGGMSPR